jgi:predicted pyridoxine 5'-phosphate oxidase superfamily flavin-nucleotide-binding protein
MDVFGPVAKANGGKDSQNGGAFTAGSGSRIHDNGLICMDFGDTVPGRRRARTAVDRMRKIVGLPPRAAPHDSNPSVVRSGENRDMPSSSSRVAGRGEHGLLSGWKPTLTTGVAEFIGRMDSIYIGTADEGGQPYIQHRGGPPGFLRVIDPRTLAFADFSGNRQYVTVGHLAVNPKAFIFLMDYERQQRVKIFGTARVSDDPALMRATAVDGYDAEVERVIVFAVGGWTANCPQHIPPRLSAATIKAEFADLRARIAALEAENAALRADSALKP